MQPFAVHYTQNLFTEHTNKELCYRLWFCASVNPTTEDWNRCFRSVCVSNSSILDSNACLLYIITSLTVVFLDSRMWTNMKREKYIGNRWGEHDSEQRIFYSIYLSTYIIIVRLSMFLKEFSPRLHFLYSKHSKKKIILTLKSDYYSQFSVSRDLSEIFLICWSGPQQTIIIIIIKVENYLLNCLWKLW